MRRTLRIRLGAAGLAAALALSLSPAAFAVETDMEELPPTAWVEEEKSDTSTEQPNIEELPVEEPPVESSPVTEDDETPTPSPEREERSARAATGAFTVTGGTENTDYSYANNTLTILSGTELTIGGTATSDVLVVAEEVEANLTFDGLSITAGDYRPAVAIGKGGSLTLTLAADVAGESSVPAATLTGGKGRAAIEVPKTATLTIAANSTGTLNARAGGNESLAYPAAIGASAWMAAGGKQHYLDDVGTITIDGGTINATAGNGSAAGIGAACTNNNDLTSHGVIIIKGGTVTATGDPGIGARYAPDKDLNIAQGRIEIHGGTVNGVHAGSGAGGILSTGTNDDRGSILIDGGTVTGSSKTETALGGDYCTVTIREDANVTVTPNGGIGIGGKEGPIVEIEGGTVTATDGSPANIGGGTSAARGAVSITGGSVTATTVYTTRGCGIGGNYCDVNLSGGDVTAQGGYGSAGIGATQSSSGTYFGNIEITGGYVTATGTVQGSNYGAGIGTAANIDMDSTASIIITGGTVIAKGASKDGVGADGIGLGSGATGANYFSTTDKDGQPGNALIIARSIGDQAGKGSWSGVIFEGTSGAVYANPTLAWDGEIPAGSTLENGSGHTLGLAEDVTLAVKGTINNHGTFDNDGTVDNHGTINNHGIFNDYGTLNLVESAGKFVNIGVFNWYGQKTETGSGNFDTSSEGTAGNVVNYASTVVTTANPATPTYGDAVTLTATITRRDKTDAVLTAGGTVDFFVDGTKVTGKPVAVVLSQDEHSMTATYTAHMKGKAWQAGTHTVTASYSGSKGTPIFQLDKIDATGATVTVAKKPLENGMIAAINAVTFNGSAHTPAPVLTHTVDVTNAITAGDYTVTHTDNTNAGTATATVTVTATEEGNYSGTATQTFTINKAAAPEVADTIKNLYYQKAYTGLTLNVAAKLPTNKGTTTYAVDTAEAPVASNTVSDTGVLTYTTSTGAIGATHTITVTAVMQNYENATAKVKVTLKDKTLATISGVSVANRAYNGQPAAHTGDPVTNQEGYTGGFEYNWFSRTVEGADTTVAPLDAAPVNAGSYRLTVSIPDSDEVYMGSKDIDFTINPATVTVAPGTYAVTKVYDGANTAGTSTGALAVNGIIAADKDTVSVSATPGAYATTDAATGLKVNAALALAGDTNGNYTLAASTLEVPASITPKAITIATVAVANRPYDGTTAAEVTAVTFNGTVASLAQDTGYTAVGSFESAGAGTDKQVDVTVTLLDGNYTLADTTETVTANITKATAGAAAPLGLDVANKSAYTYSVNLPAGLPALAEGCTFGTVGYTVATVTDNSGVFATAPSGSVPEGILSLPVKNVDSDTATPGIATVAVTVSSGNYEDFTITLTLNTVNLKVPAGVPTSEGTLTYGQSLSELKLTGEMKDGDAAVPGVFSWSNSESCPAVNTTQAMWVFVPADETVYLTVSGETAITVEQATPAGTPTATVSESGKTLADAGLAGSFTNPHNEAAIAGSLTWNDAAETAVSANQSFGWTFAPEDTVNYKAVTGTLTPWRVSYGGGGVSNPGVKNPDGSTTTTATDKKTGTVTETTKWPDGSQTVVESRTDGSSTVEMKRKDGASSKTEITSDGKTESTVVLTDKTVKEQQGKVVLPMPEVTVTAQKDTAAIVKVEVPAGAEVTVEIPAKGVNAGTVAILVLPNGEEQIVKSSVATDAGVVLSVSAGATIKIVDNSKSFGDVSADHWGTDAIQFTTSRELFQGVGTEAFAPAQPMTRGMLMTVLARYDGQDTTAGESWYSAGMDWATANGISDGTSPDGSISREQLAVMLYRYAGSPAAEGTLEQFADGNTVSDYAADALKWAVEQGVVSGKSGNALDPLGNATRAEVATMLQRFVSQTAK